MEKQVGAKLEKVFFEVVFKCENVGFCCFVFADAHTKTAFAIDKTDYIIRV